MYLSFDCFKCEYIALKIVIFWILTEVDGSANNQM